MSALLCLGLPLTANNRAHGRLATCLDHLSQVQRAWALYAADHQGRLVGWRDSQSNPRSGPDWVNDTWLDFNGANPGNWDPARFPLGSPLWPYSEGEASIHRCPADPALVRPQIGPDAGVPVPRTRSRSLNGWVAGSGGAFTIEATRFRTAFSLDDLVAPGPAGTFTFLDEREDSLNDGVLLGSMDGYEADGVANLGAHRIIDYPADWHDRGVSVAFGDGHVEMHRWVDPRTAPVHRPGQLIPLNVPSPGNPDVAWLQDRSTRRLP